MKTVLIAAVMLLSTQAFAFDNINSGSSLDEISKNSNYSISAPQIAFGGTYISVLDTCLTADGAEIRTKAPVQLTKTIHHERSSGGGGQSWDEIVPAGQAILYTSTEVYAQVEDRDAERREFGTPYAPEDRRIFKNVLETQNHPYEIAIVEKSRSAANPSAPKVDTVVFTKSYNLENCTN